MGNESPEDRNLLNFLAASFEGLRDRVESLEQHVLTGLTALGEQVGAGFATVRGDIERVHLRLDTLDRALTTRLDHVDTEISRLRSVVYLLAKDQPELLRLLGPTPTS